MASKTETKRKKKAKAVGTKRKPKTWEDGTGKWTRLNVRRELTALAARANTDTELLRLAGLEQGGKQTSMLKKIAAKGRNPVILPSQREEENKRLAALAGTYPEGEGGWDRLKNPFELAALAAVCNDCTHVLKTAGVTSGGKAQAILRKIAAGCGVNLPISKRGEAQLRTAQMESGVIEPMPVDTPEALHQHLTQSIKTLTPEQRVNVLLNTNAKLITDLVAARDHSQLIKQTLAETIVPLQPIQPNFPDYGRTKDVDEEMMILNISDIQGGQFVFHQDTGGLETYDWDVFLRRKEIYEEGVHRFANEILRKAYPIRRCLIIVNGDIVEGENVYPLQMSRIDKLAMQQIVDVGHKLVELIAFVSSCFDYVQVMMVYGNHGLVKTTRLNLDWLVYQIIAAAMALQPNVDVLISDSHFMAFWLGADSERCPVAAGLDWTDVPEILWNYNVLHGDNIRRYLSTPYYGLERAEMRYMKACRVIFDGTFVAHHHRAAAIEDKFINGSWVATNEYAMHLMQGVGRPCQKWFLFHPKQGITLQGHIHLDGQPTILDNAESIMNVYTPATLGVLPSVEDVPL